MANRLLDEQAEPKLQELYLRGLSSSRSENLMSEDKELINAIVRSGLTQLRELDLSDNSGWWNNDEARSYLFDFIKE